ncbi:hypothetical protein K227x_09520 [Rubripirellula lacrimiformis]|uniref:HTTM domain-containing protein n=1 Tax=Rubripirellula lacrimiformis TaxID=1930273 RepID=A0A517N623_9BACT|nr:hypothetical protein [Rubripirellula lacrimiformis]QDT02574.1 hypothetical protein K227x_09520 [Rubripirellula lacrimiformis]
MTDAIPEPPPLTFDRVVLAHRVVQLGMLAGLLWKISYFVAAMEVYRRIPLRDDFFPDAMQSTNVLIAAFMATCAAIVLNIVTASRPLQLVCGAVTLLGSTVLCIHQGSYNDMTFVTTWWTALWSLWYIAGMTSTDADAFLRRAAFLSRLILSMILLGGAAGKWTGEYWSGEVFFDIYFRNRDFWLFNLLRDNLTAETLREVATWYSRKVIIVETVAGLGLWMLPARWAAAVGIVLLSSIALLSNFLLFSVLMCLIGLASVGFFAKPSKPTGPKRQTA